MSDAQATLTAELADRIAAARALHAAGTRHRPSCPALQPGSSLAECTGDWGDGCWTGGER